jgi:hypothetical protein
MDAKRSMSVPRTLSAAVFAVVGAFFVASIASAAVTDNVENWAWSPNAGWISMNCTNLATCAGNAYGVTMAVTPGFADRADISGWAWSDLLGWICFGMTCSGTTPEGGASYAQFRSTLAGGTKTDQFVGWAKMVALGDSGWIALNCENRGTCATSSFHVGIDNATGDLNSATASEGHWMWNGNDDGSGIGWIDMSRVHTQWTSGHVGLVVRPQGIFEPTNPGLVGTHLHTFDLKAAGIFATPGDLVQCNVRLPDGATKVLSRVVPGPVALRGASFDLSYAVQNSDTIDDNVPWIIQTCRLLGGPEAAVCTTDANCAAGRYCDTGIGRCRTLMDSTARRRPIFTHGNLWTGLGAAQDQYDAIKCHAGFPGEYLKNAAFCDFTGDATFSLLMRRGIPVEGDCGDSLDNDGNGQIDCADRYCKGLSYLCTPHRPTQCVPGAPNDNIADCSDPGYVIGSGDLCCTNQRIAPGSSLYHIATGIECKYKDKEDGYFDCDCTTPADFGASTTDDCFAPGAQTGGLCCDTQDSVQRL